MAEAVDIPVEAIRMDGGTQPRMMIDGETIDTYAEEMKDGCTFPPVVAFYDGSDYWLADGFHRLYAAKKSMLRTVRAEVHQGTRRDAVLYSVGANATHGKPRTNADKRRAVMTLLRDEEWGNESDNWIAKKACVSDKTVTSIRRDFGIPKSDIRIGSDGRTINTANIGKTRKLPEKPEAAKPAASAQPAPAPAEDDSDPVSEKKPTRKATPKPPSVETAAANHSHLPPAVQPSGHKPPPSRAGAPALVAHPEPPDACPGCDGRRFDYRPESTWDGKTIARWVCQTDGCGRVTKPSAAVDWRAEAQSILDNMSDERGPGLVAAMRAYARGEVA